MSDEVSIYYGRFIDFGTVRTIILYKKITYYDFTIKLFNIENTIDNITGLIIESDTDNFIVGQKYHFVWSRDFHGWEYCRENN